MLFYADYHTSNNISCRSFTSLTALAKEQINNNNNHNNQTNHGYNIPGTGGSP